MLGTVFALPLLVTPRLTIDNFGLPKLTLLLAVVIAAGSIRVAERISGGPPFRGTALIIPAVAVGVPVLVSWLLTPYRVWALIGAYMRYTGLLPTLAFIAFGVLLADAFRSDFRPPLRALAGSAVVVAIYGLAQLAGVDPIPWTEDPGVAPGFATIGQFNFTGGFLGIALPVTIALAAVELDNRSRRRRWVAAGALIGVAVALINSQGGWAAALAGSAVTLGLLGRSRLRLAPLLGLLAAVAVSVALISLVLFSIFVPTAYPRLHTNITTRTDFWRAAAFMLEEAPVVGRGPNSFAIEGIQHRSELNALTFPFQYATDPHSVLFNYLSGTGALGGAGFCLMLAWATTRGTRWARTNEGMPAHVAGTTGGAAAYFTQSLVSIDAMSIRMAFWVVLAGLAVIAARGDVEGRAPPRAAGGALAPVAVLLVGLIALVNVARLPVADIRARRGAESAARGDVDGAIRQFEAALGAIPHAEYRQLYSVQLGRMALENRPMGDGLIAKMEAQFEHLETIPHPLTLVRRARSLANWGFATESAAYIEKARLAYEEAKRLDPFNVFISVELADVLVALGQAAEAREVLEEHAPMPADYDEYWGSLALVNAELGRLRAAQGFARRALRIDPQDPRALRAQRIAESSALS